jgi:arylsulfatase A-like enzyme
MGKQNLYDHSVRVPLIMSGPGIPEGRRTDALCYLLDIFPTLCGLSGLDVPGTVEGVDLLPAMRDPAARVRETLHLGYKGFQRGVRRDGRKLIEYAVKGKRTTQLFDLRDDPHETRNLVADPAHAAELASLREELERWRTELGDTREMGREFWGAYDSAEGAPAPVGPPS